MSNFMQPADQAATITWAQGQHPALVEGHSLSPFFLEKNEAAVEAAEVIRGFRSGPLAVIDACVRTAEAIGRFRRNPIAVDEFLAVLAEGGVISHREAKLGLSSPKLSMICKIGDHAELLCRDEILEQFVRTGCAGYTLIYQILNLYDGFPGDEEARFDQLIQTLRAERPNSRKSLIDRKRPTNHAYHVAVKREKFAH
jgi:hypothetical protein